MALTAVAAMAIDIIEPEDPSRMMISFAFAKLTTRSLLVEMLRSLYGLRNAIA